ncbi:hypothetical protein AVEN_130926-1 [Araneus ventricosus]|uniref:Uncharacterized protein n=1 Tax=Araneus ventricosus TaxID=182803 RepID=A0A4Y2FKB6_ARAVE|nr:hypothetical protein AVEN_130926-1 [Araneus ventricosus]
MKTKATSTNDKCEVQRGNERTSKIQTPKKNYLHRLKGNYTLQLSSLFSGLSDRKEGHPPSYAQGHIERETVRRNRCPLMEKNSAVRYRFKLHLRKKESLTTGGVTSRHLGQYTAR